MKTYHLVESRNETYHAIKAESVSDLYEVLKSRNPDEEVRLNGHNYKYVTNVMHHMAAGYPLDKLTISDALSPAHFNLNFYYILGITGE